MKNYMDTEFDSPSSPPLAICKLPKGSFLIQKEKTMNITIFTTSTCAYCDMVKRWLKAKNYTYNEVNVEDNPQEGERAFKLSGQLSVPVTLIETTDKVSVVIGYNIGKMMSALN